MLRLQKLHQVFNQGEVNEVEALHGVNLHLPEQQFVTVIGSNGAGKSTLFNVISGVFEPTRGNVVIDGDDVTDWSEHRWSHLWLRGCRQPNQQDRGWTDH